ncbi:hypothetical protein C8R43DRAFT_1019559 [Mycena crocata]|nr:hypothetical protein C8R43DRAFT_1019559 [Mycena crocata]
MTVMTFSCDGCSKSIPATDPRIQCVDCENYDLCSNCAVGERFTGTHTAAHRTRVFKISGGGRQAAVPSSIAIVYGGGPPVATPATNRTSIPPPLPSRQSNSSGNTSTSSPTQMVAGWGPFFYADMSPTPVFSQLMHTIMTYLDTGRTGHLVPEAFSKFLDDQGYVGGANVWKANLIERGGKTKEDVADVELRRVFDLFSIEYILHPRPRGSNDLAGQFQGMTVSGGTMPLLTLKGFMDITAVEMLCDPSAEWGNLSRALKVYDIPALRGWGAVPRTILPEGPDPRMKAQVARATEVSRQQGQRDIEASRVRLMLEQQGQQNAMDLLDDRRYYYTYR